MRRIFVVGVALLAVVGGLTSAPFSHAHPAGTAQGEGHHGAGVGLVRHGHFSSHQGDDHHQPAGALPGGTSEHEADARAILTADDFVFPPVTALGYSPVLALSPSPVALAVFLVPSLPGSFQPPAHGPPHDARLPSRAPPRLPAART